MIRYATAALCLIAAGCTAQGGLSPDAQSKVDAAAGSRAGQLFCTFQLAGGGQLTAGIIDMAAGALPGAGGIAVLATNMGKAFVDDTCRKAAQNVTGATGGVPVSPPPTPASAPQVAVAVAAPKP